MIRKHNRMVLSRKNKACPKDPFVDNPLMQDDYESSKEMAQQIEEQMAKLQVQSDKRQAVIQHLKMAIHEEYEKRKHEIKKK